MLQFLIQKKLPFAIWSLPGEQGWQGIAQNDLEVDQLELYDISKVEGFIVAPFESKIGVSHIRADIEFDSVNFTLEFESEENVEDLKFETKIDEPFSIDKESYIDSCEYLIEIIKKGKADKAVLSRVKSIAFDINKLIKFFTCLIEENQNAMVFMYSTGKGIWIGASPEIFIEIKNNLFKTMALAGSKSVDDSSEWGSKEIEEQQYVTRFIQKKMKRAGISFKQSDLTTMIAGPVAHLQTIFTGKIENDQLSELIVQLHPTPAVCGIPKEKALDLIIETENHQRGDYTGYFGPIKGGDVSLFVNLRSALLTSEKMHLFIGGGITAGSVAEKEWEETELKAQTLLNCYKNC